MEHNAEICYTEGVESLCEQFFHHSLLDSGNESALREISKLLTERFSKSKTQKYGIAGPE